VPPRQRFQSQVVEVVAGVVEAEDGEILGRLKDGGDRDAGLGGVMDWGPGSTPGEALDVEVSARVEDVKCLRSYFGDCSISVNRTARSATGAAQALRSAERKPADLSSHWP